MNKFCIVLNKYPINHEIDYKNHIKYPLAETSILCAADTYNTAKVLLKKYAHKIVKLESGFKHKSYLETDDYYREMNDPGIYIKDFNEYLYLYHNKLIIEPGYIYGHTEYMKKYLYGHLFIQKIKDTCVQVSTYDDVINELKCKLNK